MQKCQCRNSTSYLTAIVKSAISDTIYERKCNKCKKFDLENKVQGQEERWDLCHSTGNV